MNNLVIPEKVTNLGRNSFSGCKKLTKITAPVRFFKDEYISNISRCEELAEEVTEEPYEEVTEPAEEVTEEPYEEVWEEPAEEVTEEPCEEVCEEPAEECIW